MNTMTSTLANDQPLPSLLLVAGLGLGIGADILLVDVLSTGPGLSLWMTCFGLTACRLAIQRESAQWKKIAAWSVVAIVASLVLVFRNLPAIILAMVAVMFCAATMVCMEVRGLPLRHATIADCLAAAASVPFQAITGALPAFGNMNVKESTRSPRSLATLRGILIALPLILVFGSLFSQADLRFETLVTDVLMVFSPTLPEHIMTSLVFSWLAAGLLAVIYRSPEEDPRAPVTHFALGFEETLVVMGALVAIFLAFVTLQLPYLFGGQETIAATEGLSLAEYARRGFFELVFVAALTLATLLVVGKISTVPALYRKLACILLACVLIILASALQRLLLYTQTFGLTIDRITALTFLVWIAACLVMYGSIILRGRTHGFATGATYSAVAIAFGFALINPAAIVIRVNTGMEAASRGQIDYGYFRHLGSDGIPVLMANLKQLADEEQCQLADGWLQAMDNTGPFRHQLSIDSDWRNWNSVKHQARKTISENREFLAEIREQTCPARPALMGMIFPPPRLNAGRESENPARIPD